MDSYFVNNRHIIHCFLDPKVLHQASPTLLTSSQECIKLEGKWSGCSVGDYEPTRCPCPYENYPFDKKLMICTQGTERRTGKNSIQDGEAIETFWRKLGGSTETLDPFDKVYQRPMKNKCTGDSGSKA